MRLEASASEMQNVSPVRQKRISSSGTNSCDQRGTGTWRAARWVVFLVAFAGPAVGQPATTYPAGVLIPSGTIASNMVLNGDFNGDGNLDVITFSACASQTNCDKGNVAVRLGNGDGTFQAPLITLIAVSALRAISVGDFNGDGKLDVAAVSDDKGNSGTLTILAGRGDGTFTQSAAYPFNGVASQPFTLTVGDFNGDGNLDLVATAACYNMPVNGCSVGAVLVYPGKGDGTLGNPQVYTTIGNSGIPVAAADFNGDGNVDIAAGNPVTPGGQSHSSLTILVGNGDGTFAESIVPLSYYGITSLVAADFNSDGRVDLATTGGVSTEVLFGNGDGTFKSPVAYSTTANQGLAVADFNGDGNPDLVVGASNSGVGVNQADILINDGAGNFQITSYPLGGWAYGSVAAGDFNGDGSTDVMVSSICSETSLLRNHCPDGTLGLLLGNGDGTMRSANLLAALPTVSQAISVLTADLNGDGIPDLIETSTLASGGGAGAVTVYLGNGGGSFATPVTTGTGAISPRSAILGDFNNDGNTDLAVAHLCSGTGCQSGGVVVLLGNGDGTFQPPVVYPTNGLYALGIAIGDVNGDGQPDLAAVNQYVNSTAASASVAILLGNGDGTFRPAVVTNMPGQNNYAVAMGDFNRDGKAEVAVLGTSTDGSSGFPGVLSVLRANPDGTLNQIFSSGSVGYQSQWLGLSLAVGDVNNDGALDIVTTAICAHASCNDASPPQNFPGFGGGGVSVFLGNGTGSFTPRSFYDIPDANFESAALADVDGDGKLDVVAATLSGVAVFHGNGDGTLASPIVYAGLAMIDPTQLAIADINGDGAPDIVEASNTDNRTAIFFH